VISETIATPGTGAVEHAGQDARQAATDARTALQEASRVFEEAQAAAVALQARLEAGEPVTTDELVSADAAVRVARMRLQAAVKRSAAADEQERLQTINGIVAALPDRLSTAGIDAAFDALRTAAAAFMEACKAHDDAFADARDQLASLGPLPASVTVDGWLAIYAGRQSYRPVQVKVQAMIALKDAFEAANPGIAHEFFPR
jgi:hypothetical protein